jgi:hypothetical protein
MASADEAEVGSKLGESQPWRYGSAPSGESLGTAQAAILFLEPALKL